MKEYLWVRVTCVQCCSYRCTNVQRASASMRGVDYLEWNAQCSDSCHVFICLHDYTIPQREGHGFPIIETWTWMFDHDRWAYSRGDPPTFDIAGPETAQPNAAKQWPNACEVKQKYVPYQSNHNTAIKGASRFEIWHYQQVTCSSNFEKQGIAKSNTINDHKINQSEMHREDFQRRKTSILSLFKTCANLSSHSLEKEVYHTRNNHCCFFKGAFLTIPCEELHFLSANNAKIKAQEARKEHTRKWSSCADSDKKRRASSHVHRTTSEKHRQAAKPQPEASLPFRRVFSEFGRSSLARKWGTRNSVWVSGSSEIRTEDGGLRLAGHP